MSKDVCLFSEPPQADTDVIKLWADTGQSAFSCKAAWSIVINSMCVFTVAVQEISISKYDAGDLSSRPNDNRAPAGERVLVL